MWYMIGSIDGKKLVTTFAVDRISNIRIVNKRIRKIQFDPKTYFKYSFGVTVSEADPIEVILSFTPQQGNYLKTLPIHETQNIKVDNDDEFRISIKVQPSYEFYSKILSYGNSVRVISPKSVMIRLKETLQKTLALYEV